MKKLLKILMLGSIFLLFGIVGSAGATEFHFVDNDNYWPSWYNSGGSSGDDLLDQIGGPKVESLHVWTDDTTDNLNNLKYIVIEIGNVDGIDAYNPTALFIDNTGDFKWDYYVEGKGAEGFSSSASLYNVHDLYISLFNPTPGTCPSNTQYKISEWPAGAGSSSDPNSYRENHPAGIESDLLSGLFKGNPEYGYNKSAEMLAYDFTRLTGININLSDNPNNWLIGFTEVCANDVILGGNPVPEPATLLLLGSGLLGLAGIGRKKFRKV